MKKKLPTLRILLIAAMPMLFILGGCGLSEENRQLKEEMEAMKAQLAEEIEENQQFNEQMGEVGRLLDSIDVAEENINISLESGTSYDDYATRLRDVNQYVEETKQKIAQLESALSKTDAKNNVFASMIKNLRKTLEEKEANILALNEQVEKYKKENQELITRVDLQEEEIADKEQQIKLKREELEALEKRVEQILVEAKSAEADALFARAQTTEEVASRTKFAPKKKKETLQEAYNLYKQAFEAGREDAYAKMQELEEKL